MAKKNKPLSAVKEISIDLIAKEVYRLIASTKISEAKVFFEKAIKSVKNQADIIQAYLTISKTLRKSHPLVAIEYLTEASNKYPKSHEIWILLSFVYFDQRNKKLSLAAITKVYDLKLTPVQLVDVGRHLTSLNENEKALEFVKKGFKESEESFELATYTLRVALHCADWDLAEHVEKKLLDYYKKGDIEKSYETPRTHLLWCQDEAINMKVIAKFAEKSYPTKPHLTFKPRSKPLNRPLNIGYLSSDFREHATSLLAMGLFRHMDRERFKLFAYCVSYDDGSAIRRDVLSRFHSVKTFSKVSDKVAAEFIIKDEIDVLIDLNGLTEGSRLGIFAYRPAPVQISYLGFPGTVGGRFVDYVVGDDYTVPLGNESIYPEKIIRIPPTYQINDYDARFLPPTARRASIGVPNGKLIMGMFNNINKVNRESWQTWMKILAEVPEAILWLMDPGPMTKKMLIERAKASDIEPDRLVFAPKKKQEEHIARLRHCDIIVDPWPYGGHTTTGDALFAGIPMVALEGRNFASRVSGGLLRAAGLTKLIRPTFETYIETAVDLLKHPEKVAAIKKYLLDNRHKLDAFNAQARTLQLENAYVAAYKRFLDGLPPIHINSNFKAK